MSTPTRPNSIAASMIPWMLNLATRLLARSLNMPEPLLQTTSVLVSAVWVIVLHHRLNVPTAFRSPVGL